MPEGQNQNDQSPQKHQHAGDEEKSKKRGLQHTQEAETRAAREKRDGMRIGADRRHDSIAVDIHQLADGHDLVPALFQIIENHRQCGDSGTPVAAAVVEENDVSIAALVFDALKQFLGRRLLPVAGIDVFEHRHVAEGLSHADGLEVFDIGRVGVRVEWRPEQRGGPADERFDQALGGVEFELCEGFRQLAEVRVGERMVADFVAFVGDALEEVGIKFGVFSDHKEDRLHAALLENIKDGGRPIRIRAVVECDAHAVGIVPAHSEKRGMRGELDIAAGNPPLGILRKSSASREGRGIEIHHLARADRGHGVSAQNLGSHQRGFGFFARGEDLPNAGILEAESIDRDPAEFGIANGVPLIRKSGGVGEPDLVRLAGEVVGKIRVERRRCAADAIASGVARAAHRIGKRNFLGLDFSLGAIVAVNADANDPFRRIGGLGHDIHPTPEPIQRHDRTSGIGVAGFFVKQDDEVVHMRGEVLEIPERKSSVGLDAQPGLEPAAAEFVGHKRNEFSKLMIVALFDFLPVDEHSGSSGGGEFFREFFGEGLLR